MRITRKLLHSTFEPPSLPEVRPQRPAKDIVAEQMVERKAYNRDVMRVKGRFASHAELISFLNGELAKGNRARLEIAADAHLATSTLTYLIYVGKVQKPQSGASFRRVRRNSNTTQTSK